MTIKSLGQISNTTFSNACPACSDQQRVKHASENAYLRSKRYLKVALKPWNNAPFVGMYPPATMLLSLSPPP